MTVIKNSVIMLMPCAGPIHPSVVQCSEMMLVTAQKHGFHVLGSGKTQRTLVHTARNWLSNIFLDSEAEWAFWMDSDMILPVNTIPVMINRMKQVGGKFATGVYYQREGLHKPLVCIKDPLDVKTGQHHVSDPWSFNNIIPPDDVKEPFKVDACGFGVVLTHRDVYEKMKYPYFRFFWPDETGKEMSEDYYFCNEARKLGIDLWCLPELDCGHMGDPPVITKHDFVRPNENPITIEVTAFKEQPTYTLVEQGT